MYHVEIRFYEATDKARQYIFFPLKFLSFRISFYLKSVMPDNFPFHLSAQTEDKPKPTRFIGDLINKIKTPKHRHRRIIQQTSIEL